MEIQTTININNVILEELNHASGILHVSKTWIIRLLIKQFLDDEKTISIFNSPVKYQTHENSSCWSTFHLSLHEDEYELCLDLRKVYKMSLSYIIAYAVRKYLKKIIMVLNSSTPDKISDNYLYHNYAFSYNIINGIKRIKIHWGVKNLEEIITDNYQNTV